jgi:hypothetical protein
LLQPSTNIVPSNPESILWFLLVVGGVGLMRMVDLNKNRCCCYERIMKLMMNSLDSHLTSPSKNQEKEDYYNFENENLQKGKNSHQGSANLGCPFDCMQALHLHPSTSSTLTSAWKSNTV